MTEGKTKSEEANQKAKLAARRERKYERERRKRDKVAQHFNEICKLLNINEEKMDRTAILERVLQEVNRKNDLYAKYLQMQRNQQVPMTEQPFSAADSAALDLLLEEKVDSNNDTIVTTPFMNQF